MKPVIDLEKEYGLVFDGGGARGAYQIGAWKALEEAGISGELTNKSLLALSIINNVKSGDLKSVKYAVQLLNEDKRYELENEKLREEIEFLKIRQEELKSQLSLMQSLKDKITINMDVNKDE